MPKKGYKQTEEHIEKNRKAHLGKKHSEESKQKMRGHKVSKEAKEKNKNAHIGIKNAFYGKHHTEEAKKLMQDSHPDTSGENNGMYGKHHTEEAKQKISDNHAHLSGEKNYMYGRTGEKNPNWNGGRVAAEKRHRGFGFIPLNEKFLGSDAHHLDKELVLYIPSKLHESVWHNVFTGQGMEEINNLACEYVYGIKTEEE